MDNKTSMPALGMDHAICTGCRSLYDKPTGEDDELCPNCRKTVVEAARTVKVNQPVKVTLPKAAPSTGPLPPISDENPCPFCKLKYNYATLKEHWNMECSVAKNQQRLSQASKSFNLEECLFDIYVIVNLAQGMRMGDACTEATSMLEARDKYLSERNEANGEEE